MASTMGYWIYFPNSSTPPASAVVLQLPSYSTGGDLLGHHQALAGGVSILAERRGASSCEVEVPPAKAWWCPACGVAVF